MRIKTILVPLNGLEATSPALEVSLGMARRLDAHVAVCHVALDARDSVAFLGEGMTGAMVEEIMAISEGQAKERGERARALFESVCARLEVPIVNAGAAPGEGFSTAYVTVTGREEEHVAVRGRLADLIVVNRPTPGQNAAPSATLQTALRETGRPVLVVPPEPSSELGRVVAIAWNGSVEAGRAIGAALPLLTDAERVIVFSVGEEGWPGGAAEDVVTYLAWHGIAAGAETVEASPRSVGGSLLGVSAEAGADLLVMGAYTHSRLHRLIYGGATREVLETAKISVLMAH